MIRWPCFLLVCLFVSLKYTQLHGIYNVLGLTAGLLIDKLILLTIQMKSLP